MRRTAAGSLNLDQLDRDSAHAIEVLSQRQIPTLRIVGLGLSLFVEVIEALEFIISGWTVPPVEKEIQFVVKGEPRDNHHLHFCKTLVLKKMCKTIEYYNTDDYSKSGDLKPSD